VTFAGKEAVLEVNTALGRELAWQSRQLAGSASFADWSEPWKLGTAAPLRPVAHVTAAAPDGLRWQTLQSATTIGSAVGAPFDHTTASCFISPEVGLLAGLVAVGPTKPTGTEAVWHSAQVAGCEIPWAASDA
jgi:hypothetical protein